MIDFYEFLGIAVISLVATFILFRYLSSHSTGSGKFMGFTISYGGSLGGFIAIFYLLHTAYSSAVVQNGNSKFDLTGEWEFKLETSDGVIHHGKSTIKQKPGSIYFDIGGLVEDTKVDFSAYVGVVAHRKAIFVYENSQQEMGIALTNLYEESPKTLVWTFTDMKDKDNDLTPHGVIEFNRINGPKTWYEKLLEPLKKYMVYKSDTPNNSIQPIAYASAD